MVFFKSGACFHSNQYMILLLLLGRFNEVAKVRSIVIELATATTGSFQISIRICDIPKRSK